MMDRVPKNPGFWVLKCFKKHVLLSVSFYTIFVLMQYLEIPFTLLLCQSTTTQS